MLDETLLADVQKRFSGRKYGEISEIEQLFDIYVPDFELKNKDSFTVILNDPIYLFDGLPFAKILLPKTFLALDYERQVDVLCEAIEKAWGLVAEES